MRRAISVPSSDSNQAHSAEDGKDDDNMVQLSSDFVEDINNKWVYRRTVYRTTDHAVAWKVDRVI